MGGTHWRDTFEILCRMAPCKVLAFGNLVSRSCPGAFLVECFMLIEVKKEEKVMKPYFSNVQLFI